jgi:hypothetical protein
MSGPEITLARAAGLLGYRYNRVWNLALSGVLDARQTENGRWMVSTASVERLRSTEERAA